MLRAGEELPEDVADEQMHWRVRRDLGFVDVDAMADLDCSMCSRRWMIVMD